MSNIMPPEKRVSLYRTILYNAAVLFLQEGYTNTTLAKLAAHSGIQVSKINREFGCKENILLALVNHVLNERFLISKRLMADSADDPILRYALDTSLRVHLAECCEALRDMYVMSYTLPEPSRRIRNELIERLIRPAFADNFPYATEIDYSMMALASTGILLNFMKLENSEQFTPREKQRSYLKACLRLYCVPEEKIKEAIAFVEGFDMARIANDALVHFVDSLLNKDFFVIDEDSCVTTPRRKQLTL